MGRLLNFPLFWDSVRTARAFPGLTSSARGTHQYAGTVARRWIGVKNRARLIAWNPRGSLAPDANLAEAQQDASTTHRTPESELGTEAREQQNLIELAL
jgi:hypothetical protein